MCQITYKSSFYLSSLCCPSGGPFLSLSGGVLVPPSREPPEALAPLQVPCVGLQGVRGGRPRSRVPKACRGFAAFLHRTNTFGAAYRRARGLIAGQPHTQKGKKKFFFWKLISTFWVLNTKIEKKIFFPSKTLQNKSKSVHGVMDSWAHGHTKGDHKHIAINWRLARVACLDGLVWQSI